MAIEDITVGGNAASATTPVTVDTGAGSNRLVALLLYIQNTGYVLPTSVAINGVEATLAVTVASSTGRGAALYYWLDADLPATPGTYDIITDAVYTNRGQHVISCSGVEQAAPADVGSDFSTVTNTALQLSLTVPADSIVISGALTNQGTTASWAADAGQVAIFGPTLPGGSNSCMSTYDPVDGNVGYTFISNTQSLILAAGFAPAASSADPTITSVNGGAPIQSAQTGVPVIGTLLEQVTAVRVVDSTAKGVDVTASWAGSGTSGTFDAPDFLTEGLKFGVIDVEFDWQ